MLEFEADINVNYITNLYPMQAFDPLSGDEVLRVGNGFMGSVAQTSLRTLAQNHKENAIFMKIGSIRSLLCKLSRRYIK